MEIKNISIHFCLQTEHDCSQKTSRLKLCRHSAPSTRSCRARVSSLSEPCLVFSFASEWLDNVIPSNCMKWPLKFTRDYSSWETDAGCHAWKAEQDKGKLQWSWHQIPSSWESFTWWRPDGEEDYAAESVQSAPCKLWPAGGRTADLDLDLDLDLDHDHVRATWCSFQTSDRIWNHKTGVSLQSANDPLFPACDTFWVINTQSQAERWSSHPYDEINE